MSLDSTLATPAAPPFIECVSEGNGAQQTPGASQRVESRLQELIEQIESQPNPAARALLQECLQSMLAFYGQALGDIIDHLKAAGAEGEVILHGLLKNRAISSVLLVHGLHPIPLETRLRGALEKSRPYMQSHGGNIELLSLENEVARVKLSGTCKSCPSSAITLQLAVRRAVEEACPDLIAFELVEEDADAAAREGVLAT